MATISDQSCLRSLTQSDQDGITRHELSYFIPGNKRIYVLQAMTDDKPHLKDPIIEKCFDSFRCEGSK
jgi:hypothetical protein